MKFKKIIPGLFLALAISVFSGCPANPDFPEGAKVRYMMIDNVVYRMMSYYDGVEIMEMQNIPLNVEGMEESLVPSTVCEISKNYFVGWAPSAEAMIGTKNRLYVFNGNGKVRGWHDFTDVGMVFTSDLAVVTCSKSYNKEKGGFLFSYYDVNDPVLGKLTLTLKWSGYLDLFVHDAYFDSTRSLVICGADSSGTKLDVYYIQNYIIGAGCTKVYSTERLGGDENPEFMRLVYNMFDISQSSCFAFTSVQNRELAQNKPFLHMIQLNHVEGKDYEWYEQDMSSYSEFPSDFRCIYGGGGMGCQRTDGDIIIPYVTDNDEIALMFVSREKRTVGHIIRKTKDGNPVTGVRRVLTRGYQWKTGVQYFVHGAAGGNKESFASVNYTDDFIEDMDEVPLSE